MGDTWVFKKTDERTNQRAGHIARSTEKIKALNFTPAGIFLKFKMIKSKSPHFKLTAVDHAWCADHLPGKYPVVNQRIKK
jgi:hypothetical protein